MGTGKSALKELAEPISKALNSAAELSTQVPGLALYRNTAPTAPNPCTYEPSLLLIPQGKKRVDLGKQSYVFGESTFLLTSLELPIVNRVSVASVEKPYLAFFFKLDMDMVRDVSPHRGGAGFCIARWNTRHGSWRSDGRTDCAMLTHGSAFRGSPGCPVLQ